MSQPQLFDTGPDPQLRRMSRASDPITSREAAAEHIASGSNAVQRAAVLDALSVQDGLTSDEIAALANIDRHAAGRRMSELERDGQVKRGEARMSRVGGRSGLTWWIVSKDQP